MPSVHSQTAENALMLCCEMCRKQHSCWKKAIQVLVPCQVGIKLIQYVLISVDCVKKENGPAFSVMRQGTPNSHLLSMERFLVNSECVFCDPLITVLRVHMSICHSGGSQFVCHAVQHQVHKSFQSQLPITTHMYKHVDVVPQVQFNNHYNMI